MSGTGRIELGLNILGVQQAKEAAQEIENLRRGLAALNSVGQAFPQFVGPFQGLAQARPAAEDHMRIIADMAKQTRALTSDYDAYQRTLLDVGKAYGYTRDQALQAADAMKQVSDLQTRMQLVSGSLGFARGYGMDPAQVGGQMGSFARMGVVNNQADQTQFMFMLSESVAKGSTGGMNILMEKFLPILTDLSQRQLAATPGGVNAAGIADVLTRLNASGTPGFRDEGGARVFGQLDAGIRGAQGGLGAAVLYPALAQGRPDYDYAQYRLDIAKGASDPRVMTAMMQQVSAFGGPGNDPRTRAWKAAYAEQIMPSVDLATWNALMDPNAGLFDTEGHYITEDKRTPGLRDKYGAAGMDPTFLGLLTNVDQAKSQADLELVRSTYKSLAGKDMGALSGDLEADRLAIGKQIGQQTEPAMALAADRRDKTLADTEKAYEDSAIAMNEFSQKVREANLALAEFTKLMITEGSAGPLIAGAGIGGNLIGGLFGGAMSGLSGALGLRAAMSLLGRVIPAAAGGTATATATGGTVGGAGGALASGGLAELLGAPLAAALAGAELSALAGGAMDRLGGGQGRQGWALPAVGLLSPAGGIGMPLGTGLQRWATHSGPLADTGLGAWLRGNDEMLADKLPGYAGVFGRATPYQGPTPGAKQPPSEEQQQDQLTEAEKHTALLGEINQKLGGSGVVDQALNARYGAGGGYNAVSAAIATGGYASPAAAAAAGAYGRAYVPLPPGVAGPVLPPPGGGAGGAGGAPGSGRPGAPTGGGTGASYDPAGVASYIQSVRPSSPIIPITGEIIDYAEANGVDPALIFGQLQAESGFASDSGMGTRQNNPGNIMAPGADPANGKVILRSYPTMLDGVKAMIDLLAGYNDTYGDRFQPETGQLTLEDMVAIYYVGPEAYAKYGLQANDAGGSGPGGNGTVQQYLDRHIYPTRNNLAPYQRQPTGGGGGGAGAPAPASPASPSSRTSRAPAPSYNALMAEGQLPADSPYLTTQTVGAPAATRTAGGGGGPFFGTVELVVKMPGGGTERHWVEMQASSDGAYARVINFPRGKV